MRNSIDDLKSICKKREIGTRKFDDIAHKLEIYDKIVCDNKTKPFVENISQLNGVSEVDKFCLNFITHMQDHLWTTIAILSAKEQTTQTQLIRNDIVDEICETILTNSYFGFNEGGVGDSLLKMIKEAIKTHYKIIVYDDEVKRNE